MPQSLRLEYRLTSATIARAVEYVDAQKLAYDLDQEFGLKSTDVLEDRH